MSKQKLWQAIGVWSHPHQDLPPQKQTQNNSSNQPNSVKDSLVEIEVAQSAKISSSHGQFLQKQQQSDLSIEIESCESQALSSEHEKPLDVPWCSSKFFLQKAFRSKIKAMSQQISCLKQELGMLREAAINVRSEMNDQTHVLLTNFYNKFSKPAEEKPVMIPCQRCEQSKTLIDQLTRQCWQLQARLKEVTKAKEEQPMKKIENNLLQQRGEAVRRLKAELQQAREENEGLLMQLSACQQQASELQAQYKSSLLAFKSEIQAINQACCTKIQQIIQEKAAVQNQLYLLQQKCLQQQQIKRTQKRYLTQFPQNINSYSPLPTAFAKNIPFKTSQFSNPRKTVHRNTASLADLDISNFDIPTQTRPQSFKADPSRVRPYLNIASQSRKNLDTSESSFGSALERLGQIQKEVRRQINRSKKSFK